MVASNIQVSWPNLFLIFKKLKQRAFSFVEVSIIQRRSSRKRICLRDENLPIFKLNELTLHLSFFTFTLKRRSHFIFLLKNVFSNFHRRSCWFIEIR